ncbi:unnamed protein product, partial [Rotaria sp. Silwood2]
SIEGSNNKKIWEFLAANGHYTLTYKAPRQTQLLATSSKREDIYLDTMKHSQHVAHQLEYYSNRTIKK